MFCLLLILVNDKEMLDVYDVELLAQEKAQTSSSFNEEVDLDELKYDPELEKLHADRIAALKWEAKKRQSLTIKGHGEYREISEGDFLGEVTGSEKVVCHFYHREFYRCKFLRILCLGGRGIISVHFSQRRELEELLENRCTINVLNN
nr:thioredoxin domain-containing protein PLP3B-like [Tanacetum cinerariifolium]